MDTIENYPYNIQSKVKWTVNISPSFYLEFMYDKDRKAYDCVFSERIIKKLKKVQASGFTYYYDSSVNNNTLVVASSISTVKVNEAKYSSQEVNRARRARELMEILFHPSDETMIRTLVHGTMLNCNVTPEDVRIAAKIYGRSVPFVMGRWKDLGVKRPLEVLVPKHTRKEQTVYADILAWREVSFLLFIIKPLKLLMVQWLPKGGNMNGILEVFDAMICSVKARCFAPSVAHVDPAKVLTGLTDKASITINTVGTGAHVADAEVEIKLLKEILRSSKAGLAFPVALRFVRSHMLGGVMFRNTMLRRGCTISPREDFTGVKFDIRLHARAKFMQYYLGYRNPKESNSNEKGGSACIFLRHTGNATGTVMMYDLITKSTFRCDRFTTEPMPELIVNMLRKFAEEDEPKELRKRPPAWMLARVMEQDEALEVDDIDNDPRIRALIAVPGARQQPRDPAHIDAEIHINDQAPQEATNEEQDVAATTASDNRVHETPQPEGSYPESSASGIPTVQEDEENSYESEDDVPGK